MRRLLSGPNTIVALACIATARDLVTAFLAAKFTGEERHVRRLDKVEAIEAHPPRGR